jgi:hypothetical protein
MTALARTSSNCKRQTRLLVREGALHQQTRNCLTGKKNLVLGPRQTDRLTVGHNIVFTLTLSQSVRFESIEISLETVCRQTDQSECEAVAR